MNENLENMWFLTAEIFIFVVASIFALQSITSQEKTLEVYYKASQLEERRIYTSLEVNQEEYYTGAEVLQSIYQINSLNVDIKVDAQVFNRYLDIDTIDVTGIDLKRMYKVSYLRDQKGVLQTIVFS
ncbi:hypothetical protein J2Z32_000013 [Paenibacillus turicensis]|uniref:Competence protein ComGF n=1 Tax=Paenibacillus turicensis TaxID=160487 RepID=A0ABS4FLD9_9BACL|nr:hypothetical protein [Paenibacillus turicensis]MBP1903401.1 hypothetical protein [Paenibacillus turicensis]